MQQRNAAKMGAATGRRVRAFGGPELGAVSACGPRDHAGWRRAAVLSQTLPKP